MHCEKGIELVREASRSQDSLQPFNEDLVRQTLEETKQLWEKNRQEVEELAIISPSVSYRYI